MGKKKFFETDQFKKLNAEWAQKLKDNGFNDIDPGDGLAIQPEVFAVDKTQSLGGLDYHQFCQQILREFRFKKEAHRLIFELHAEGRSDREIQEELARRDITFSHMGINKVIHRTKETFLKGVS